MDPISIAKELIRTKSLSGNERDLAYLIKDLLASSGVDNVFIDKYGNVIGYLKGEMDETLVFEGHMDHVPEGNLEQWNHDPYEAIVAGDKLYGRGSVDMKGAIAAMISSINNIRGKELPDTYYIFVPFEEVSEGALLKLAVEETLGIKPDLVVLGEATKLNIHRGHRGRSVWKIVLKGKSSHASMPDEGINPISALSLFIAELKKKQLPYNEILGRSTLAPTIIECNPKSTPMIPDTCELYIDYRMIIEEDEKSIKKIFVEVLESIKDKDLILDYVVDVNSGIAKMWTGATISYRDFYPSWLNNDTNILANIMKIVKEYKTNVFLSVWRFSTDGVYSAGEAGIPTIGIGPGDERLAHQPNEYVPVKEVVKASKIYSELVMRFRSIIHKDSHINNKNTKNNLP